MERDIWLSINNLRKSVTCSVCLDFFAQPARLPCGHRFCAKCIDEVLTLRKVCPVCSSDVRRRSIVYENDVSDLLHEVSSFLNSVDVKAGKTRLNNCHTELCAARAARSSSTETFNLSDNVKHDCFESNEDNNRGPLSAIAIAGGDLQDNDQDTPAAQSKGLHPTEKMEVFCKGSLVHVAARTSPGINKQGGVGRIINSQCTDSGVLYDVKYVLDGSIERALLACHISAYQDLEPSNRRQRPPEHIPAVKIEAEPSAKRARSAEIDPTTHSAANEGKMASLKRINPRDGKPIVLLSSALDPHLQSKLTQLSERCTAVTVTNTFSEAVTHLVVEVGKQRILKHRTMKYLQAVMTGKWIVSVQWVADSLRGGKMLCEEDYEVLDNVKASISGAPRRARLAHLPQVGCAYRGIFNDYAVVLYGNFPLPGPAKSDIADLLRKGGAQVHASAAELVASFAASGSSISVVVVSSEAAVAEVQASVDADIVQIRKAPVHYIVTHNWVLDCAVNFSVSEPK